MMIRRFALPEARRSRRGFTLLEALIAVTGIALMLGLCAVTLQLLMRLNGTSQARLGAAMTLERLARQLREDVHACETAVVAPANEPEGKPASLRLSLEPKHLIDYQVNETSVRRLESRDGKPVRRESYDLIRGRTSRLELRA